MPTRRIKYETDKGSIFFVECDADTSIDSVLGTIPTGAETENLTCKVSKNNNQVGISPRHVVFARLVGTDDTNSSGLYQGGRQYKYVPIPTVNAFGNVNTGRLGDSGATQITHRGETYTAVDKNDESIK